MKKLIKILSLLIATFFFHDLVMGERVVISAADSSYPRAISNSDHTSDKSYLFTIPRQAEGGINNLSLLLEISVYSSEDDSSLSILVQADAQRRVKIFLHQCRIVNQLSELTKLIYPFHFFF